MKTNRLITIVISVLLLNVNTLFAQNTYVKLDLESNTELANLYSNEKLLSSLDMRPNIKLSSLSCNNNELKSLSVNNEHTSYSEDCAVNEGEIPDAEYNCLVELYNSTLGEDWTNNTNWLDTVNSSVGDWYGITVENGHVTRIELPNNNMQEGVFENPLQLPELEVINLSGNKLMDANFYSLDSLSNMTSLHIENNNFIFKHIIDIQNLLFYNNFSGNFSYSPQGKIDAEGSVTVNEGDILEIDVAYYWLSENDEFQWYQNGTPIDGETNSYLDLSPASKSDSGTFYLEITNPRVSDLTLQSQNKEVYVNDIMISNIPISEYEALVALYHSTDGENWKYNDNWLDTTNHVINDWYGVTVEDGHVTELTLSYNKLKGVIPLEIGDLSKLTSLDLYNNNDITGSIPKEIGNLINLVDLNLKGNYLTGSLPNELGNLSKLITLDLSFNRIQGKLPKELGNLTELRYLYLNHNTIEGPLPGELSNLKKLEVFYINANWLGKIIDENTPREPRQIPANLQEMSSLWTLRIGQNHLLFNDIEPIFSWSNFSNFIEFKYELQTGLHKNTELNVEPGDTIKLTIPNYEPAPSDTYSWKKDGVTLEGANDSVLILKDVQLDDEGFYYCNISNEIATGVDIFVYSTTVKVNDVHGAGVPISEYQALVDFYYSNNGVNWKKKENWLDTINVTVNDWEGIYVIDGHVKEISMDTNNISGSFPRVLYKLRELERLNFYMNNLSGSLPDDIDSLLNLRILFLSDNNFEGNIPGSLGDLDSLYLLNINNNQLSGPIPSSMGDMNKILFIELAHNNLSGTIPSSFGNLTQLRFLDLSHNQLVGPLTVELKNLQNISRFIIDYNLIGETDLNKNATLNKSATIDNNRQIPDELAGLIHMDTLHLGGNKLQFNDIEAIFSWENSGEFKEFIYAPQDSIGITKTENKFTGESATLSIHNYFPGPSDRYQWYKNGNILPGDTTAMLNLNALQISDAGKYYCKITNPVATGLTLYSRKITVQVSEEIKGAGVPLSEYEALVAIYNSTNGQAWTNNENWLDTVSHSVSEWFGITVENGKITTLNLSGLNLEGNFSSYFTGFDSLKWLDLSNNKLSGEFPGNGAAYNSIVKSDGGSNQILKYLDISNNNFVFAELEPAFDFFQTIDTFIYAPQSMVGLPFDTTIYKNQPTTFKIANYTPGSFDSYSWSKDGTEITDADEIKFVIQNAAPGDSGYYTCSITNLLFPELTLLSDTSRLNVLIAVGTDDFKNAHFNIYPNPAEKQIFVETGNRPVNLKLFDITGTLFFGKDNFMSGWINIEPFSRGIYIVRIISQNSETITKKVIFK